jgi:hypothetical protein
MNEAFKNHRDKRISELHERMRQYRIKKKVEVKIFGKPIEKTWKTIDEINKN